MRSSDVSTRRVSDAAPRTAVVMADATSTRVRCAAIQDASEGQSITLIGPLGRRVGSRAGTSKSVRMPHATMLCPITSPSCWRLGKSTNTRP